MTASRVVAASRMMPDPQSSRRLRMLALLCVLGLLVLAIADAARV